VIASLVNAQFSKLLPCWMPQPQRGFIPVLNFGVNFLELDVLARVCSCAPTDSVDAPVAMARDAFAAIPGLSQTHARTVPRATPALPAFEATFDQLRTALQAVAK
ncbi:unnamed protein product, partial [Prorocentrum cordatum]